jgi:tRNA nucleotidyltransferase/poly(A) polymerase
VEEDMKRRDLTINALALDEEGQLIDLFGGGADLKNKILRHVREENFFIDPLRVLRTCRFRSQLPGFQLAPETLRLMKEVVKTEAFKDILSERVIKELKRVFECSRPSLFFETLDLAGGKEIHFPGIKVKGPSLDSATSELTRFAVLFTGVELPVLEAWRENLGIQNDWYELARAWILYQRRGDILEFFYRADVFRKPYLVEEIAKLDPVSGQELQLKFSKVRDVSAKDVPDHLSGKEIGEEIRRERARRLNQ